MRVLGIIALAGLACANAAQADETDCAALAGKAFPAGMIGLPTSGAKIASAQMRPAREGGRLTAKCWAI